MAQEYKKLLAFRADPPPPDELEWTQSRVWLSRTCACGRAGLLGVPLKVVDLLIDARIDPTNASREQHPRHITVLEIGQKAGHLSGDLRDRWTWRSVDLHSSLAREVDTFGVVEVDRQPGATQLLVRGGDGLVLFERTYPSLRWVFDREQDAGRILMWHYDRHFRFLPADEAEALAQTFLLSKAIRTVSEANREAERALYHLARALGWRRMTLRERIRVWGPTDGPDRPIWHRQSEVAEMLFKTGAGEATHRAAAGGDLAPEEEVVVIRRYTAEDEALN